MSPFRPSELQVARAKTVPNGGRRGSREFSDFRENVQPPGSPGTSATKVVFRNKGNPAAVRLGDIFEIQNSIEFGQKNNDFFLAKFRRREQTRNDIKTIEMFQNRRITSTTTSAIILARTKKSAVVVLS